MKGVFVISLLVLSNIMVYGQGTIWFLNRVVGPGGVDSPVFYIDGITKLSGTGFLAQLYAGPTAATLKPIGASMHFLTGPAAGYFDASGVDPTRVVSNVVPGEIAWVEVRAWELATGDTWETARIRGASPMFSVITGDLSPYSPTTLFDLQSFSLQIVPEPSTLTILAFGGLLLASKRLRMGA